MLELDALLLHKNISIVSPFSDNGLTLAACSAARSEGNGQQAAETYEFSKVSVGEKKRKEQHRGSAIPLRVIGFPLKLGLILS
ncbi:MULTISPECIES: hypothetical protein [Nitrosospira]|nr:MULTISPECIES: hypothetical protein [Nitrosospira]